MLAQAPVVVVGRGGQPGRGPVGVEGLRGRTGRLVGTSVVQGRPKVVVAVVVVVGSVE